MPSGVIDMVTDDLLGMAVAGYGWTPAEALAAYRAAQPEARPASCSPPSPTDWFFRVPALRVAEAQATGGGQAYVYEFAWRSPQFGGRLGACHALELAFVFDTIGLEANDALAGKGAPQELADAMHAAWVRFVTDGDPGWPAYDTDRRAGAGVRRAGAARRRPAGRPARPLGRHPVTAGA